MLSIHRPLFGPQQQTTQFDLHVSEEVLTGKPASRQARQPPIPNNSLVAVVVILLLSMHVGMLAHAATRHSPTMMEPAFLVAGLSHWEFGRFELFRVNPPLVRMLAALPVMAVGYEMDWSGFYESPGARPVFSMGENFITVNGERSLRLITLARWACIPISLIGALFCFLWSQEFWGSTAAGLIALSLWCFEPNILAHGELITTDCAAAAFGIGAGYCFWRWLRKPTWVRTAAAGVLLGLALLSKATWIILLALWPVLWLIWRFRNPTATQAVANPSSVPVAQLLALMMLGVYVLNLGYGFDGSLAPLKEYRFVSSALAGPHESSATGNRFANSVLGNAPVPLPKQFLVGIDIQRYDIESFPQPSYLHGEWKQGGWWYYYLYGLLVKIPHGVQLLILLSIVTAVFLHYRRELPATKADLCVLLLPAITLLILISSHLQFNHHFRYVLPCFGFAFVLGGGVWMMKSVMLRRVVVLVLLVTAFETVGNHPHALAYFNPASGGASQGYRHMLHSNLDWEQDLLLARRWMLEKNLDPVELRVSSYYPFLMQQFLIGGIEEQSVPRWNLVSCNKVFETGSPWIEHLNDKSTERIGNTLWAFPAQK